MKFCKILVIFILIFGSYSRAEELIDFSGHLKLRSSLFQYDKNSFQDIQGVEEGALNDYNFRPRFNIGKDKFNVNIEAEFNGVGGSAKRFFEAFNLGIPLLQNDDNRLFNLSTKEGEDGFSRVSRLDRLSFSYETERANIKVGRQAFSYGKGIAFSVLDVFNPFSPTAYDREFKVGEDMLTFKGIVSEEVSVQLVGVGRREGDSSFGSILNYQKEGFDVGLLAGSNWGDLFSGLSASKTIGDYIIRLDTSLFDTENSGLETNFLFNIDRGLAVLGFETYLFIEYFYSGLGEGSSSYSELNVDLIERVRRGELFTLSKQYVSTGFRVQLNDLVELNYLLIGNLLDSSSVHRPFIAIEPSDNTRIRIGVAINEGSRGDEFKGFNVNELNSYVSTSNQAFLQLAYYF